MEAPHKSQTLSILVDKLVKILAKTVGRDKVIRFWQYFSLFIAYTNFTKESGVKDLFNPKWEKAASELRTARKVLRFFRTAEYTKKIVSTIKDIKNKPSEHPIDLAINITSILNNLSTVLFFIFDHRVFLAEVGVISQDNLKSNFKKSFVFWFLECFFAIIKDLLEYSKLKKSTEMERVDKKSLEPVVSGLSLNIIKNIGDCIIALARIRSGTLNQQQIGALGTITSVIGIYQLFQQQ